MSMYCVGYCDKFDAKKVIINVIFSFLQCYELILQNDPSHIPALHNLCAAHFQMGRLDDAEACLQQATTLAPTERYIQHHLSLVQQHKKKLASSSKSDTGYCSGSNCGIHLHVDKVREAKETDDVVRL